MMRPLSDWPLAARQNIIGVFTDIDDTLTTAGAITPDALQALAQLKAAGLHVIPITGRPIGWSEQVAFGRAAGQGLSPAWPVDSVVAENGAAALMLSQADASITKIYQQDVATRMRNDARMQQVAARVVREVSGAKLSKDSSGRETDIAIDHSEFTQLSGEKQAQVIAIMQSEGMNATVSSIHINGWFGDHNKLSGARWIVRQLFGRKLVSEMDRWVYVGDSTNDALMFEHFAHSVGVANIRQFEAALSHKPRYVTPSERGAGFAEFAQVLLEK